MGDVIRLVDTQPVACGDPAEIRAWADAWLDSICAGDYGRVKSLVLVVERDDGQVGAVTQSIASMDTTRLVGLLTTMIYRKLDGRGSLVEER